MNSAVQSQLVSMGLSAAQAAECLASVTAAGYAARAAEVDPLDAAAAAAADLYTRAVPGRVGWTMVGIAVAGVGHVFLLERGNGPVGTGSDVEMVGLKPGAGTGDPWA